MEKYEKHHWATSYSMIPSDLYYGYTKKHKMRFTKDKSPKKYWDPDEELGRVFTYFYYLVIKDIIENQVTFKLPVNRCYLEMTPIIGEDFVKARQNGAFRDVDFLMSNFTGYNLNLRIHTRYGKWLKRIYVSSKYRDLITELTNKGVGW